MLRRLILILWLAVPVFLLGTVSGCGDKSKSEGPQVRDKVPDNAPKPLGAPSPGGGGKKPVGPKPNPI